MLHLQCKLRPEEDESCLEKKIRSIIKVPAKIDFTYRIIRKSLDARKKPELYFVYLLEIEASDEEALLRANTRTKKLERAEKRPVYVFPKALCSSKISPIIVGMGPAGLFCAYFLAKAGFSPLLLERGKDVDSRQRDVEAFWAGEAPLNPESNVQFGEGGAGTFSDGKLNTLVKDKDGKIQEILKIFHTYGASKEILYDYKPHVGTDLLRDVVKNMRNEIIKMGGRVCYESCVDGLLLTNNCVTGVQLRDGRQFLSQAVVLATGHSARDTFLRLFEQQVPMTAKPFAVGLRVMHLQQMINESQYGSVYGKSLSAAPYKLTAKLADKKGVYSFCMCPGGYVVNASSEPEKICVNGMSYSGRNGELANSAIVVTIEPKDYGDGHPMSGIVFQRKLEEAAFRAGEGAVPVQTYQSFKRNLQEKKGKFDYSEGASFSPGIKGEYRYADLTSILPQQLNEDIVEGMESFGRVIQGFNRGDTLLAGVESRTSSPVKLLRDENCQSSIKGLYPCGEGAGYAGGIVSAALDGIRVAEAIAMLR